MGINDEAEPTLHSLFLEIRNLKREFEKVVEELQNEIKKLKITDIKFDYVTREELKTLLENQKKIVSEIKELKILCYNEKEE